MQAGGEGDQTIFVLSEQIFVYPRPVVKSFQLGDGHHFTQVAVADHILCQQDNMGEPFVVLGCFIGKAPGGNIAFTTNNRLNAGGNGLTVELDSTEHRAVVCQGYGVHTEIGCPLHQVVDSNRTVQEAVLGVNVQVNEIWSGLCHGIGVRVSGLMFLVSSCGLRV